MNTRTAKLVEFNFQDKSEEILNELQDENFEVYKPIR